MSALVPMSQQPEGKMTLKEKLAYTVIGGVGLTALIIFTSKLIKGKIADKSDSKSFEAGTPQTIAKDIKMALDNKWDFGPDTKALRGILQRIKSKAELESVRAEYNKQFKKAMYADIEGHVKSTEYVELYQIMQTKPDKTGGKVAKPTLYKAWATRLKAAVDRKYTVFTGTDEEAIKAVLYEVPTQQDFVEVGKVYLKDYHANIVTVLKSELSASEYVSIISIVTTKRKN